MLPYGRICDEVEQIGLAPADWLTDDGRLDLAAADAGRLVFAFGVGAAVADGPSPQTAARDLLARRLDGRVQLLSPAERATLARLQAWTDVHCS